MHEAADSRGDDVNFIEEALSIVSTCIVIAILGSWMAPRLFDGERFYPHRRKRRPVELNREEITVQQRRTEEDELANLMLEAEKFILDPDARASGVDLLNRLQEAAYGLGCNRATEFSADNQKLALLAAKVALLTFGRNALELARFERAVHYYDTFPSITVGSEYDAFKASL